jgi:hypothetical protein
MAIYCYFPQFIAKVLPKVRILGSTKLDCQIDRERLELFFHFHQFVVEILGEIRIIGIADVDEPINQIAD